MIQKLLIIIGIIFSFSTIQASEVSEWFEKESNQFLEIINNNMDTLKNRKTFNLFNLYENVSS